MATFSNADPKVLNTYQRHLKKIMFIVDINLMDNQLVHIKSCKGPAEVWKILCNIYETKNLSNFLFVRQNFFTYKIEIGDNLWTHVNKVKAFSDQLNWRYPCEKKHFHNFAQKLASIVRVLITTLKTMPMKELMMA